MHQPTVLKEDMYTYIPSCLNKLRKIARSFDEHKIQIRVSIVENWGSLHGL